MRRYRGGWLSLATVAGVLLAATLVTPATTECSGHRSLMADPADSRGALVIDSACQATSIAVTKDKESTLLDASEKQLEEIVSYPPVASLILNGNSITPFDFSTDITLQYLDLGHNDLATLNGFAFPSQLRHLIVSDNSITSVVRLQLPGSLNSLDLTGCALTSFRGFRVPPSLASLALARNQLIEIEVRQSDLAFFVSDGVSLPAIQTPQCGTRNASVVRTNSSALCVISDAAFDQLYGTGKPTAITTNDDESDNQQTILFVVLGVGSLMLIAVLFIGYRVFKGNWDIMSSSGGGRRRRNRPARHNQLESAKSSGGALLTSNTGERPFGFPMEYFEDDDVRYDAELTQYRIAKEHLEKKKVLAKGGFGVVYLAKYQGMNVAVKQLQRDKMRYSTMQHFMKEIRLCASLNHPNVVGFLGVSWSTLHDVAVVIEYMPRGDLYSFLRQQRKKSAQPAKPKGKRAQVEFEWFLTTSKSPSPVLEATPTKASIAVDVADALAYLHAYETPIIHRDLKSKNVLLADDFNAKISDFGISRMQDLEETMTREVGTVAWIAPEVLKGARYTEKADIYSFGVLITELDTCHLPYTIGFGSDKHKRTNTWIASMVSAGVLQPVLLDSCPASVRELALECMQFDPDNRPSAGDIVKRLKAMIIENEPKGSYVLM